MQVKALIDSAKQLAQSEVDAGKIVLILFPNEQWRSAALPQPEHIYLRASTTASGLKSLAIDTLILVGQDHSDWSTQGELLAREKLRTSCYPLVILVECEDSALMRDIGANLISRKQSQSGLDNLKRINDGD